MEDFSEHIVNPWAS